MNMQNVTDQEIKKKYLETVEMYNKGENWNVRIVADELKCPASYVREVLAELEEKGEI